MSAEAAALVRSWPVGRYTCTLTAPQPKRGAVHTVVIEWSPEQPKRLTHAEIEQYREGRDAAFLALGLNVLILEA